MNDLTDIYKSHANLVYRYLYRLCGNADTAEELTQETFYQLVKSIKKYRGECAITTWICQIAKYSWYNYIDKIKKHNHLPLDGLENILLDAVVTEDTILRNDLISYIYDHIDKLPEKYKEVVLYRLIGEYSYSEISKITGKSETSLRVLYHKAKLILIEKGNDYNGKL